jgi:hypothetical protein
MVSSGNDLAVRLWTYEDNTQVSDVSKPPAHLERTSEFTDFSRGYWL